MTAPPLRHVTVECRVGSRQHFYHFFLGVLLPLARYLAESKDDSTPVLLEECGPMDALLDELGLPGLILLRKSEHRRLARVMPPAMADRVTLDPLDVDSTGVDYDPLALRIGAGWLLDRWRVPLETQRRSLQVEWPARPRILVVDRGPADPFYASEESERKTAGAERRRVGNHDEVVRTITDRFPGCRSVLLEGRPLLAQIALFQLADVVVAQHGAALANMVWMRPEARIIEFEGGASSVRHFIRLAAALGLSHRTFAQDGPFDDVDAEKLADVIAGMAEDVLPSAIGPASAQAGSGLPR